MTSYILRKAAADRTGADALVVGVLSTGKGPQIAPGGEGVADAYGKKLKPLLATLGFTGKAGPGRHRPHQRRGQVAAAAAHRHG